MFRVMRFAITSFSNEKVKYVSGLKEKKNRDKNKHFFLEGFRELKKGFESKKFIFHSLFVSQECFLGINEDSLIDEIEKSGTPIFELPRKIFEKISYRDRPDGLIAIGNIPDFGFSGTKKIPGDFFAIIEGVEKPGNLGTILRTAEGAGVDAIFVVDSKLDIFNPNVIRASTGTIFTLPVYQTTLTPLLQYFKTNSIRTLAVTPEVPTYYFQEDLKVPVAFIFGSEQYGLSEISKQNAEKKISIPMKGSADSLNLAMSAGILFYETIRQRML